MFISLATPVASGSITPGNIGTYCWALNGNTVGSEKWIGTVDGYDLPFRTNGTERMRINTTGEVGIGGTAASNRKLSVTLSSGAATGMGGYFSTTGTGTSYGVYSVTFGDAAISYLAAPVGTNTATGFYANVDNDFNTENVGFGGLIRGDSGRNIGLKIDVQGSSTVNYGIYNVAARNYFSGTIGIGTDILSAQVGIAFLSTAQFGIQCTDTVKDAVFYSTVNVIEGILGDGALYGHYLADTATSGLPFYEIYSVATHANTARNYGGSFSANNSTLGNHAIVVPVGGGNVGIGTSIPTYDLEVTGLIGTSLEMTNGGVFSRTLNTSTQAMISYTDGMNTGLANADATQYEHSWTNTINGGSETINATHHELTHTLAISLDSPALGLYGNTPIAQPTTAYATSTFVANAGTAINDASTFDGYTIKQLVKILRDRGDLA